MNVKQIMDSVVYTDVASLIMAFMSDIPLDFNENEIQVFKCFVNPKYPASIRTIQAVVKESGLDQDSVLKVCFIHENLLLKQVSVNKWCFNISFFAKNFATKYPDMFSAFTVINTPLGVIVVPKDVKPELLDVIISKISSEMDLIQPGVAETLEALNNMVVNRKIDIQSIYEISFSN